MAKQMNEYVVLFRNEAESSSLPASSPGAAFNAQLAKWVQENHVGADVIRTEAEGPKVSMICTDDVAHRVVEAFAQSVVAVRMDRENVITIPDPLPKKKRRIETSPA
jgi:hypothetical protein